MTAKQWLNRARRIDREIRTLEEVITSTRERLESVTQSYSGDGAQSTKDPHKFDRLVELESLVNEKIDEQIKIKTEILEAISQIRDRRQRIVLTEYYLNMKTWEQVAVEINYSWRQVMNIHGRALQEMQRIISLNFI
jgi:DNA-directed RNA polymerase specialized sigma subunit